MLNIKGIDHLVLRVIDIERMIAFYKDVLGCALERSRDDIGLYQLRAGNSLIDLVPISGKLGAMGGGAPGKHDLNLDHFCLQVEPFDAEAITAYLQTHGVSADAVQTRYGAKGDGPSMFVRDPEGNSVELKGPPVDATQ
jgi:glyoxylase I family protein